MSPDVMCLMYCENGFVQDDNGCNTCRCSESTDIIDPIVTDPMPPPMLSPMPPVSVNDKNNDLSVFNPFLNTCSQVQMAVYHRCDDCQNCDFENTRTVLNDCMNNNIRMRDNLCQGDGIHACSIPIMIVIMNLCPKITGSRSCGQNGLSGYSTYRLSLIIKNPNVKNIYDLWR